MVKRVLRGVLPDRAWVALRRMRQAAELRQYRPRAVRHRYGDVELSVHLADELGEAWYDHDWPPLPEIVLLRTGRLRAGARVFDLGAHHGVIALLLADAVRPGGKVLAVEPSAHNAAVTAQNALLNAADDVAVLQAAVSDTSGVVRFSDFLDGYIDEEHGFVAVRAATIDELAREHGHPDVVFVDIEGAEVLALRGAAKTLERGETDWYVEIHAGYGLERLGGTREDVFGVFPLDRYDVHVSFAHEGEYVPYRGEPNLVDRAHALVALGR